MSYLVPFPRWLIIGAVFAA